MSNRYASGVLILQRWQYLCGQIPQMNLNFSFDERYPQILFWDGRGWTARVLDELKLVAGRAPVVLE
jgi:hypothetical protein